MLSYVPWQKGGFMREPKIIARFSGEEFLRACRSMVAEMGATEVVLAVEGKKIVLRGPKNELLVRSALNFRERWSVRIPAMTLLVAAKYIAARTRGTRTLADVRHEGEWLCLGAGELSYPLTKIT
jgi:hypothetical protein